jgi:hypothetical protein
METPSLPPCGGGMGRGVNACAGAWNLPPSRLAAHADLPVQGGGEVSLCRSPIALTRRLPSLIGYAVESAGKVVGDDD